MANNERLIDVLSYETCSVGIKTKERNMIFDPSDGITPFIVPLTMAEVQYVNSTCNHIKNGILTFNDADKEEVFKELRNMDWENIKSAKEIEDMLLNPTLEKLQWIISVQDNQLFERIRGIMIGLENGGADITTKVRNIMKKRFEEFRVGRVKITDIVLRPKDVEKKVDSEVDSLKAQLEEMKAMMATLMANKASESAPVAVAEAEKTDEEVVVEVADVAEPEPVKKAGRPPKSVK